MEKSKNIYRYPIPQNTPIRGISKNSPAHTGPFRGALDFIVDLNTPVLAPLEGEVIGVVDIHEKYGFSRKYVGYLNYITIKHKNGEYSQLAHLVKNSSLVLPGDRVKRGQKIAYTGNSGWMTEPHLHMIVFKLIPDKVGFRGLAIRFRS